MTTFQVRCAKCGDKKWPDLPERPERYVCVLCRAVTPEQRAERREVGKRALATRKRRLGASEDAT